jgi:hypothetical protein
MKTMVAQPYVNDIPTLTGGVGCDELYNFYKNHFLFANPADTKTIPISRTIGSDRIPRKCGLFFDYERGKLGLYELMDVKEETSRILGRKADIMTRDSLHKVLRSRIEASALQVF